MNTLKRHMDLFKKVIYNFDKEKYNINQITVDTKYEKYYYHILISFKNYYCINADDEKAKEIYEKIVEKFLEEIKEEKYEVQKITVKTTAILINTNEQKRVLEKIYISWYLNNIYISITKRFYLSSDFVLNLETDDRILVNKYNKTKKTLTLEELILEIKNKENYKNLNNKIIGIIRLEKNNHKVYNIIKKYIEEA